MPRVQEGIPGVQRGVGGEVQGLREALRDGVRADVADDVVDRHGAAGSDGGGRAGEVLDDQILATAPCGDHLVVNEDTRELTVETVRARCPLGMEVRARERALIGDDLPDPV